MEKVNNYSLVIRRGKNSFFPIEWSKLKDSNPNANEYSLQEIDAYTSKTNTASLLLELTQGNFISDEDYFSSIEIIYHDNNKTRILPEGPCFEENSKFLNIENIKKYIRDNLSNIQLINKIFNYLNKNSNNETHDYNKFVKLLQASREIIKDGNNSKIKALYSLIGDYINKLSYNETRRLGMYISKNLNSR